MDQLPKNDERFDGILYDSQTIAARVEEMAKEIQKSFNSDKTLLIVGILKGAAPFQMDLSRALFRAGKNSRCGFIRASTYGSGVKGEGETERRVQISWIGMPKCADEILLLDDVLDQGFTLAAVKKSLQEQFPNAVVRTAVFLEKNLASATEEVKELRKHFAPDFVGFPVPDRWIVGYGLDIAEDFRELPYVATVFEKYFKD